MAWQQSGGYAYPKQEQGPPPPGFYPNEPPPYPGGTGYPGAPSYPGAGYPAGVPYPGAAPYGAQGYGGQAYGSGGQGAMPGGYSQYGEAPSAGSMSFSDKSIRLGFIRKVYSILMIQLVATTFLIALFTLSDNTSQYFKSNPGWVLVAFVVTIVCMLCLACCESVRRTSPTNYIFLFIFTLAEGFLLGVISSAYQAREVLLAVGICAVLCFALTVFAFQTKIDFTVMGGVLLVAAIILMIFGIVLMFFHVPWLRLVYACFGAFLFSIYLIYDTQLMIGGDHKYSISPEEYVFAALNIYVDIINIFLYILQIIGETRD